MNQAAKNVETAALSLPERQRTALVLKLLDSLETRPSADAGEVEIAWLEEANRRYVAYLAGQEQAIPAEQVFAELKAEDR